MRLLLITGFLGSGKTTLITRLASALVSHSHRVAILVNEIGEIGIDNQLMKQLDFNVWELLNGCICCTLSADLVTTLEKLDREYAPDLVLVEPSGAADPRNILSALPYYKGRRLEMIRTVNILDPLRLEMLIEVMTPLITSQIQHADLIVISKCDMAEATDVLRCQQAVEEIKPGLTVRTADLREPSPELLREVAPCLI